MSERPNSTGVFLLPTDGIKDVQIRNFLDRLVEVWDERNDGVERFVTKGELHDLARTAAAEVVTGLSTGDSGVPAAGLPGADAPLLSLSATALAFVFTDAAATTADGPASITLTATLKNVSGTPTFVATAYNAANASLGTITLGGTGSVRTLTREQFVSLGATTTRYVQVVATLGSLSDTFTIYRGDGGTSSIAGLLTNEAHSVPASNAGVVASFAGAGGSFNVYRGITDVSAQCTYSVVSNPDGLTVSISASGVYAVTAAGTWLDGSSVATVTFRATYSGTTIDKVFTLTKSRTGATGATGATGSTGTRGSRQLYAIDAMYTAGYDIDGAGATAAGAASYKARATQLIAAATVGDTPTTPIKGDTVTFSNGSNYVTEYTCDGTYATNGDNSWALPGTVLDGSVLINGSVTATKISVVNLAALSANLGTITAGTLAAGTIISGDISGASGTFTGNLNVGGTASIRGNSTEVVDGTTYTAALLVNGSYGSNKGIVAHTNYLNTGEALVGVAHNGGFGVYGLVTGSTTGAGVHGSALGAGKAGVRASATIGATAFETSGGDSTFAAGYTVTFGGQVTMSGAYNFVWNGYTIAPPNGATTAYLRRDGTWATPPGTGVTAVSASSSSDGLTLSSSGGTTPAISLSGTPTSSTQISNTGHTYTFSGGSITGTATATFSSANKPGASTSNIWLAMVIDGVTYDLAAWPRA